MTINITNKLTSIELSSFVSLASLVKLISIESSHTLFKKYAKTNRAGIVMGRFYSAAKIDKTKIRCMLSNDWFDLASFENLFTRFSYSKEAFLSVGSRVMSGNLPANKYDHSLHIFYNFNDGSTIRVVYRRSNDSLTLGIYFYKADGDLLNRIVFRCLNTFKMALMLEALEKAQEQRIENQDDSSIAA